MNQLVSQSVNQSFNQSHLLYIHQSINQSFNQSIKSALFMKVISTISSFWLLFREIKLYPNYWLIYVIKWQTCYFLKHDDSLMTLGYIGNLLHRTSIVPTALKNWFNFFMGSVIWKTGNKNAFANRNLLDGHQTFSFNFNFLLDITVIWMK